ncbi:STAS domain-containing protein [Salinimonas iocasae]|uniref:STAS domain-containing protein n=1 Tax=Salinimonas iocasae TaxID=2572577 RepID=A0A5B7YFC2_9ALTE|nr:STAS domain-containing protein [Salinimonas iocasae]QCZ94080.1 STAS domain-containing protein [Salinimonas iocasae]
MSLVTETVDKNERLIIAMDEKFDFAKVQAFKQAYQAIPEQVSVVEVNLAKTEYMDSSALGMLLNMQKSLSHRDIEFKITHCRPQVARILEISRFDKKFTIS